MSVRTNACGVGGSGKGAVSKYRNIPLNVVELRGMREMGSLSEPKNELGVTSVGVNAIFGGGKNTRKSLATVDSLNTSTNTVKKLVALSCARANLGAGTVRQEAVFVGGDNFSNVDAINANTNTLRTCMGLSSGGTGVSIVTIGDMLIVSGFQYRSFIIHMLTNTYTTIDTILNEYSVSGRIGLDGVFAGGRWL